MMSLIILELSLTFFFKLEIIAKISFFQTCRPGDRMAAALQRTLQNKLGEKIIAEQFRVELGEKKRSAKIRKIICSAKVVIHSAFNLANKRNK